MPTFTSDDELSTVSRIKIPADIPVHCAADQHGVVRLAFGNADRVCLDIHPQMVGPIARALTGMATGEPA